MKKIICVSLVGVFFCFVICSQAVGQTSVQNVHDTMKLIVEPGEHWLGKMKIFIFSVQKTPQMAAWIEDENGQYIATITVTSRSAQKNWRSAPKTGRPEALPVWSHRQQHGQTPDDIDAVSTATQKSSVEAKIDRGVFVNGNTYNVYFEINHSFDYNGRWTKDNSGVNGQPSLVYHAQFIAGQPNRVQLIPTGHGSVNGSDGNITRELETFTSALNIVKNVYVEF